MWVYTVGPEKGISKGLPRMTEATARVGKEVSPMSLPGPYTVSGRRPTEGIL